MLKYALVLTITIWTTSAHAQRTSSDQLKSSFDSLLSMQYKPDEPGAVVLVAQRGRVIYRRAIGMANLELGVPMSVATVFKIGSITKQFTAIAILRLVDEGKLSLNDEITKYIPDYPTQGQKITVEHLLTHTSGIVNYSAIRDTLYSGGVELSPTQLIDRFEDQPMRFVPGTKWEYSNSGYALLGYIIERVTGKSYGEFVEENLLRPAQMSRSLYGNDRRIVKNRADAYAAEDGKFSNVPYLSVTHPYAAGSILSTVEDLYAWNQALREGKLVSKDLLQKAWSRYRLADGKETSYGYGWRMGYIHDRPSLWHGGLVNGFIAMSMYLPEDDVFVTVMSNCADNSPEDLTAKLAALAIGRPYHYKPMTLEGKILSEYPGVYEGENGQVRVVTLREGRLFQQIGRGTQIQIRPFQKDRFFFEENVFQTIAFKRNESGTIDELVVMSRERMETWKRTDRPPPTTDGIAVSEAVLDRYVGEYEIRTGFTFTVSRERGRLFLQATGQEKVEMFAESETKFFLKVNDAEFEFSRDHAGGVASVTLRQSGRMIVAKRMQ